MNTLNEPEEKEPNSPIKIMGVVSVLAIVIAALVYVMLVATGQIEHENRLGSQEIAIGGMACIVIMLLTNPEVFSRFSLIKLPGGIELKLEQLEKKQQEQQTYLDSFFAILSNSLSLPEKYHLRTLLRGGQIYEGRQSLREEFLRLKRYGLLEEVEGQKIGDLLDWKFDNCAHYVRLTENGKKFVRALDKIERQ